MITEKSITESILFLSRVSIA